LRSGKVLIYSHDTYGMGNIRRTVELCRALTQSAPGVSILVLTGSPLAQSFDVPDNVDVVFFDADRRAASATDEAWPFDARPVIAITGTEAPGRLEAMLAVGPNAMLNKPLRREGIFKALVFAYHNQMHHQKLEEKLAFQQEQVRARSLVTKATLLVMRRFNIDDDEAYAAIRSASMSTNLLVEAFAFSLMSDPNYYMKAIEQGVLRNRAKNRKTAV